jgi:hypothetical protein
MEPKLPPHLPQPVRDTLRSLAETVNRELAGSVVALVLYGDAVKPDRFDADTSTANVMVVLEAIDLPVMEKLAAAFRPSLGRVAPLVLTRGELARSTDVFPIKFLDMQRRHCLLAGEDLLSALTISDDHLRLRCEQEIKNLGLRLRRFFIEQGDDPVRLRFVLANAIGAFLQAGEMVLQLKTGAVPETLDDVALQLATQLDVEAARLQRALAVKCSDAVPDDDLKAVFADFMSVVRQAAKTVDQFESQPNRL